MSKMFKKFIALMVAALMILSTMVVSYAQDQATDYSKHWAAKEIAEWDSVGLLKNLNNKGVFKPNQIMTRAEFAALVNRLFNFTEKSTEVFKDVSKKAWYYEDVCKVAAAGIIGGDGKGNFKPNAPLSRQTAAVILARAFKLTAKDKNAAKLYSDYKKMSSWSVEAISAMAENGYIANKKGLKYSPLDGITRAAAVKMLDNIAGELKNKAGTYKGTVARNLVVNTKDITLKDMTIKGNLYLAEGIGEGNINLDNVKVLGQTFVRGGGENSIILTNTTLSGVLVVEKKNGKVRIVAQGDTEVSSVVLNSGAKLQEDKSKGGKGFGAVEVLTVAPGQAITLDGDFTDLKINVPGISLQVPNGTIGKLTIGEKAKDSTVDLAEGVKVEKFTADAPVNVTGKGQIVDAVINSEGVKLEKKPENITVAPNVEVTVENEVVSKEDTDSNNNSNNNSNSNNNNNNNSNSAPVAKTVSAKTLTVGGDLLTVPVSELATDANGDTLSVTNAVYGTAGIVSLSVSVGNLTISPVAAGTTTVTATVSDGKSSVNVTFSVTVNPASSDPEWEMVWNDEFNDTTIDPSKWTYDLGNGSIVGNPGWGNNEKELYTNETKNVREEDGVLKITALKDSGDSSYPYTSSRVKTQGLFSKKYGKFEIRAKVSSNGRGLWPAIWMLPENNVYGTWAASGEIDIFEGWGSRPNQMCGTLHYGSQWPNNTFSGKTYTFPNGSTIGDFHTYILEWEPGEMRWYVDGVLFSTQNNWYSKGANTASNYTYPAPFDQEFHLVMNLAVGGNFDGDPTEATQFPADMQIDYVRVYDKIGGYAENPTKPEGSSQPLPEGYQEQEDGNLIFANDYANGFIEEVDSTKVPAATAASKLDGKWLFLHLATIAETGSTGFGGNGTITTETIGETNFAKVNIAAPGTQNYSVQLIKTATLAKGRTYKVSFDAKASKNRSIIAKYSGDADAGWSGYSTNPAVNLTTEMQSYEFIFTMEKDSDLKARLEFNLGLDDGTIWIGNVRTEEITLAPEDENAAKAPLTGGNHVYNGTFDQGDSQDKLRMKYWNFATTDANATARVIEALPREFMVDITDGGASTDAVQLVQKGLNLINGQSYQVTFKGRAAADRTIEVELLSKDGTVSYSEVQTINLTTATQEKTFEFDMTAATDAEAQLVFKFGGANADVYLDDVVMIRSSQYIDPSVILFPLKNGDFESNVGVLDPWGSYFHNDGAAGTISVVEGKAKAEISNVGGQTWAVQLFQNDFDMSDGVEYLVEFDAMSTADRSIEVILENASYNRYFDQVVELTGEMRRYGFTFKMSADDQLDLKFLLGNIAGSNSIGAHTVYIDNVVCEVKGAKQHASILTNGSFLDGTTNWTIGAYEGASETHAVEEGALKVSIGNEGSAFWNVQVIQGDFTIENGRRYVLTFDAMSSVSRNIQPIIENSSNYTKYLQPVIAIDGVQKTYSVTFTMEGATDTAAHLVFALGKINPTDAAIGAHEVYLSNISLMEDPYTYVLPEQPAGHELLNGTFDTDMSYWSTILSDGAGDGNVVDSVYGGVLKVDCINYDGYFKHSNQVYQDHLKLEAGKTYTLSFDIWGTIAKAVKVSVEGTTAYLPAETITLTTGQHTYEYTFTVSEATENAKLVFQLGNDESPDFTPHTIYIDNVSLEAVVSSEPVAQPINGTFDTNTDGWVIWNKSGESTAGMRVTNQELEVYVPDPGYEGWETWATQVYQTNLDLEGGKTYTLSFEARATAPRDIWVEVANAGTGFKYLETQTASLSVTDAVYSFEFTMPEGAAQIGKLIFMFGNGQREGTNFAGQSVFMDNISLVEKTTTEPEEEPQTLAQTWYLNNSPVGGVTPTGEGLQSDAGTVVGWTTLKTFTDTTPAYWYSPTVSGTYSAGNWSFVLWTEEISTETIYTVSVYKVAADGTGEVLLGTAEANVAGLGNHPNTFNLNGISETVLDNQRIMVKLVKSSGGSCIIAYNSSFPTRLVTP